MQQRQPRFGFLLAALIGFLLMGPLAREVFGELNGLVMMVALSSVLVIGIFSLNESRLLFAAGLLLAVIAVGCSVADYFLVENRTLQLITLADIFVFFAVSIVLATMQLFAPGPITMHRLMGGICIYVLLGMCWAIVYMYLIWWQPDALVGNALGTEDKALFWDMIYFSFVTITTLGYGDISPVTPFARALAYTEAIVGQLYIAILIGAMVGSFSRRTRG